MPCKNKNNQRAGAQTRKPVNVIAIDGPAGSGKSTVAKGLARAIGYLYIDTGAMYRALTLRAIKEKINLNDEGALVQLAQKTELRLIMKKSGLKVLLNGQDVTREIRQQTVTEKVRFLAKIKGVRAEMVKMQRDLANQVKGAVLEGRDIGTVVFPNAKHKFYLDANVKERIRRRFSELRQMDQVVTIADISKDIRGRDQSDKRRSVGPLIRAADAAYVDTTNLSVEEVINKIRQQCCI